MPHYQNARNHYLKFFPLQIVTLVLYFLLQGFTGTVGWPLYLDALIAYIQSLPQPFSAAIEGRIMGLNGVEVRIVNTSTDETSPNPQKGLSAMEVELP